MRVIPVLDLLNSVVVRGVAGRRETYQPIESRLIAGCDPTSIACAFRESFGLNLLYIADLDAITRGQPNWNLYRELAAARFELLIDAGVNSPAEALRLLEAGASRVIVGLETCAGPNELEAIVLAVGAPRLLFSLDLREGRPFTRPGSWPEMSPLQIAGDVLRTGVDGLIVLDLAGVGLGSGVQTTALCRAIRDDFPEARLITGGGVRHAVDLKSEAADGAAGVLVSSALHDGRLTAADVREYVIGWPGTS